MKLLTVLLLAASLGLWFAVHGARFRSEAKETSSHPGSTPDASAESPGSRIAVVKDFLGEKWPLVEARLTAEQFKFLAEPFQPADCPPWPEAEMLMRLQMRDGLQAGRDDWVRRFQDNGWSKDLTSGELNPRSKKLEPLDLERINDIDASARAELEQQANVAFDLLVEAEEAIWDRGHYDACPFVEVSLSPAMERHAQLVMMEKWKHHAWTVSYTLDSSEWPTLEAVLTDMAENVARRNRTIAAYIASK